MSISDNIRLARIQWQNMGLIAGTPTEEDQAFLKEHLAKQPPRVEPPDICSLIGKAEDERDALSQELLLTQARLLDAEKVVEAARWIENQPEAEYLPSIRLQDLRRALSAYDRAKEGMG